MSVASAHTTMEFQSTPRLTTPDRGPTPSDLLDATPTHNNEYYIDDPMAIFLAGNQLFKVHRHFLAEESEVFKWMFMCPPGSSAPDGISDERAIPLPGVTAVEFKALLDFFYTEKFQRHEAVMQEWIYLLAISTRFDFQRLRECAISAIEDSRWPQPQARKNRKMRITIDPIEQIVLVERHNVPNWLPIAYAVICERSDPLDESEAEKIGYRKTVLLARARETVRNPQYNPPETPSPMLTPLHGLPAQHSPPSSPFPPSSHLNGFYHNRARVDAIVSEIFFPPVKAGEDGTV
ncbi:hypothetical protein DFH09DRAFT_1167431 [Mycena vulgaris]|nr:hypothetical protein DFH09DRAFT_1167431 [Mycena vulgaris]